MNKKLQTFLVWLVLVVVFVYVYSSQNVSSKSIKITTESELKSLFEEYAFTSLEYDKEGRYYLKGVGGLEYEIDRTLNAKVYDLSLKDDIPVIYRMENGLASKLVPYIPYIIFIAAFLYFMRKLKSGSGENFMTLRKINIKQLPKDQQIKFSDIGGLEEPKRELQDIINFLIKPKDWRELGIRMPRGILLEGPPGCGKTLLAKALASEAKASFFPVSASDFVELFVGVGSSRVRDLFEQANKVKPSIIFIDEIDAIGRRRGSGVGYNNDEREQTLNQLLVSMDGVIRNEGIIVIGATNRTDILDPALIRPGRFDKLIKIKGADEETRKSIFKIHLRTKKIAENFDYQEAAKNTEGLNGADIETLCNEAGLIAVRREQDKFITNEDIKGALKNITKNEFSAFDSQVMNSAFYLNRSIEDVSIEVELVDNKVIKGELVWIDTQYLKLKGDEEYFISKSQIKSFRKI